MERGTAQVNITEVIDQFSGPIGKIKQVEIFMYIVSAMVSFLVVFGSLRRSSTNAFLRYSIVGAFVFSFTLIINIIGQINSPNYNIFYPIWAIFVVLLYGNPYSISAYSLEDNEQWKRTYFEVLLQMFWLGWVVGKNMYLFKYVGFNVTSYIMICACSWKITERMEALKFASKEGLITGTKSVVDFMSDEHELGPALQGDPKHTRGYHYLVTCEKKSNFGINGFSTRKKEEAVNIGSVKVITVEKVWSCSGKLLSPTGGDPDSKLKDICLSYAFYSLLCCHFAGFSLPQQSLEKQRELVREGLLQNVENHERPFRVIEIELGFLYDRFYTKYAFVFTKPWKKLFLSFLIVAGSSVLLVFLLMQYPFYVSSFSRDVKYETIKSRLQEYKLATIIITGVIVSLEILQLLLFVISYWGKLLILCKYVGKQSRGDNCLCEFFARVICSIPSQKLWGRQLGQYSFLDSFHRNPPIWLYNRITSNLILLKNPGKGCTGNTFVKLSPKIQRAVLAWIKRKDHRLTTGLESLRDNDVRNEELFSACQYDTTTKVIMAWHLATSLCEFRYARRLGVNFHVSTTLSKYCAHLVVFAPRLLPDHSYITECSFKETVKEAEKFLKGCYKSMDSKHKKIMALADIEKPMENRTVLEAGSRVAKLLFEEVGDDEERMWKILADFWTEMLLFVAPSDDISAHAEYLAQGGEFVSHLWALLFHAGIVKRDDIEVVNA